MVLRDRAFRWILPHPAPKDASHSQDPESDPIRSTDPVPDPSLGTDPEPDPIRRTEPERRIRLEPSQGLGVLTKLVSRELRGIRTHATASAGIRSFTNAVLLACAANGHSPTRDRHSPTRDRHSPTRERHNPTRERHSPTRERHNLARPLGRIEILNRLTPRDVPDVARDRSNRSYAASNHTPEGSLSVPADLPEQNYTAHPRVGIADFGADSAERMRPKEPVLWSSNGSGACALRTAHRSLLAHRSLRTAHHSSLTAHRPLTPHRSPLTAHRSPLTTQRSLRTAHRSSLIAHHSSLIAHRSPLTAHRSPLTAHRSPLTAHHSSLTAHHSSPLTLSTAHSSPLTTPHRSALT